MPYTELVGCRRTNFRVVAVLAFGHVMKKTAEIEQFRFWQSIDQSGAARKLVETLRHEETPQVTHDKKSVLIDCVRVE